MNIENIAIKDIKPYERNAKKHDETQIKNVMESIKQFGFAQPLAVDENNVLIIGHCRLIAAKRLKLKEVPVVRMDDLTQEQVDKLRLLDNKLNESEWDFDLLAEDIPTLDFSDFDIDWGLKSNDNKEDEETEVEFSEILGEENNYIVLQFKNDVDWLQAQSLFDIKNVKCYSTRKDGKITKKMERVGVGRVLDGAEVLKKLTGENL
jgi:site-specific DNA-methyltransferase (adenine-specific)